MRYRFDGGCVHSQSGAHGAYIVTGIIEKRNLLKRKQHITVCSDQLFMWSSFGFETLGRHHHGFRWPHRKIYPERKLKESDKNDENIRLILVVSLNYRQLFTCCFRLSIFFFGKSSFKFNMEYLLEKTNEKQTSQSVGQTFSRFSNKCILQDSFKKKKFFCIHLDSKFYLCFQFVLFPFFGKFSAHIISNFTHLNQFSDIYVPL